MNKKKLNKKALERLGNSPVQLLEQCFANQGLIHIQQHKIFWQVVEDDKKELCNMMLSLFQGLKDPKSESLARALVLTMNYLCCFTDFNAADARIARERKALSETQGLGATHSKEVLRTLKMLEENEDMVSAQINTFSTNMLSIADIDRRKMGPRDYPTVPHTEIVPAASCCLFGYIRAEFLKGDEDKRASILKTVVDKFFQQPQVKLANPLLAETSLLALFFLLRHLISLAPVLDAEFLDHASSVIRQFFFWPNPFGNSTLSLLDHISREKKFPGYSLNDRLRVMSGLSRLPTSLVPELDDKEDETQPVSPFARAIYYMFDEGNHDAVANGIVMGLFEAESKAEEGAKHEWPEVLGKDGLDASTKARLILMMLRNETSLGAGEDEIAKAKACPEKEISDMWNNIQGTLQQAVACNDIEQATKIRIEGLKTLKNSLNASNGGGTCVTLGEDTADNADEIVFEHVAWTNKRGYTDYVQKDTNADKPAPLTPHMDSLTYMLQAAQAEGRSVVLTAVIAGGSDVLHPLLCAYAHLRKMQPLIFKGVRVRFLMIPFGDASLTASWLARNDPWYKRHVYAPFANGLFTLPWASNEGGAMEMSKKKGNPTHPGKLLRSLVESYAVDARYTREIRTFNVECWVDHDDNKASVADKVIPFSERLTLFVNNDSPPEVVVRFSKADSNGNKLGSATCPPCSYRTIELSNVPMTDDKCWPADPTSNWLEMYTATKERRAGNTLSTDPRQHVCDADIRCADIRASFYINIDGYKLGHFNRIRISLASCVDENGKEVPLTLPVASFFPTMP